jgi:hypothetical protein
MTRVWAIFIVLASLAWGQFSTTTANRIRTSASDPTGQACSPGDVRSYNGTIYHCSSGVYAAAGGAGGVTGTANGDVVGNTAGTVGPIPSVNHDGDGGLIVKRITLQPGEPFRLGGPGTTDAPDPLPSTGSFAMRYNQTLKSFRVWHGDGTTSALDASIIPISVDTSSPVTAASPGFYYNDSAGAITYNLPTISASMVGARYCVRNLAPRTGAITLQAPASTYIDKDGANGTAAGTLVSAGAAGDSVCVIAVTTTQYVSYIGSGTWSNN